MLTPYQSAYQKFHSCKTSLVRLINGLLWAIENQQVTSIVILDLSPTFNTVINELILQVLHKKVYDFRFSIQIVLNISETGKIQSMYEWMLLIIKKQCTSVFPRDQYRGSSYS